MLPCRLLYVELSTLFGVGRRGGRGKTNVVAERYDEKERDLRDRREMHVGFCVVETEKWPPICSDYISRGKGVF